MSAEAAVQIFNFEGVRDTQAEPLLLKGESLFHDKVDVFVGFSFKLMPEVGGAVICSGGLRAKRLD